MMCQSVGNAGNLYEQIKKRYFMYILRRLFLLGNEIWCLAAIVVQSVDFLVSQLQLRSTAFSSAGNTSAYLAVVRLFVHDLAHLRTIPLMTN